MNWTGRKVLVTGAGGFIGSHLVERLMELGAVPRALVHYRADGLRGWLERSERKGGMEILAGDICDRDCVLDAMRDVEVVFHLAALIAIPYSYHAPSSYVRTNVEGTLNVLQAARTRGIGRIVHTSTSEVYGTACRVPIDEAHPLQAQSPYAATKIAADKLVEAFHCSYGLPVVTVRPFNTFGPRQSSRAVIPTIITQCLNGGVVRLGNVTPTRDLNYVTDTVEGFLLAAAMPDAIGRTINIGSGREVSVGEVVRMVGQLLDKPVTIETDEQRVRPNTSEVERLVADNSLAGAILKWTSRVPLEDGLRLTVEWLRANLDKYRPGAYVV